VSCRPSSSAGVAPDADATVADAISDVQRLVAGRAPPDQTYQAVLDAAVRLLAGEIGSLRFVDREDSSWMIAVATRGVAGGERWRQRSPVTEGLSGLVISTGQAVVENRPLAAKRSQLKPPDAKAIIGVPLHEGDQVIGSILVGTTIEGRTWSTRDRELLSAYAEQVGISLSVARANYAVAQASTDSLTGLGNRPLLLDRLEHELVRADRGGEPATVLFLDLDRFKLVNDSLGHLAGDQLLVAVAKRLRSNIREGDVCARLGGDEFAVLLTGACDPVAVAKRIIDALQQPFQISEHEVFVGVSIGIATGRDDAATLLRSADVAMYHAKRAGSGRFQRFEPSMHATLLSRLSLDSELRRAVRGEQFELRYQPIVDLRSGRIAAFEALLRWRHPARGLLAPKEFIEVATETGLIVEIGRRALRQACSQFAIWWREAPLAINVNVSMRELQRPGYAATLEEAIGGAFPASALILDVSESAPLKDEPGALQSLGAVKELGARVALDDFGTGYSSLLNLAQMPVDLIKIAKPFVAAVGQKSRIPSGLLAGIVGLGRHLGLMTVAEGVERPEQRALLIELGCELGQGYLLGPPLDAAGAGALLGCRLLGREP
jgi:diguanylate cyclase (GGDEF)-like protein